MKAIFCYDGPMYKDESGSYYDSILNDQMFERYFKVADQLELIIRTRYITSEQAERKMHKLTNPNITVCECPNLSSVAGLVTGVNKAKELLRKKVFEADLIFIRLPSVIGNIAIEECKKQNKKYLVEVVGCTWDSYWNYSIKGKFLAPIATIIMKHNVKYAPYVLYVTNKFLQKRYPTNGRELSCSDVELMNLSDTVLEKRIENIKNKVEDEKYYIGTAGGLDVLFKGQHYVVRALNLLEKEGIDNVEYQVIGVGTGTYIKNIAKKYGVEDKVKIVGQLPHDEVFAWMDNLDIYIQPSRQEGLPRSVVEAMSRALPCFGANTAGIPELLPEDCIFSNSQSEVLEISNLIKNIINSKTKQIEYAKINYEESKKYEKEKLDMRRQDFYNEYVQNTCNTFCR